MNRYYLALKNYCFNIQLEHYPNLSSLCIFAQKLKLFMDKIPHYFYNLLLEKGLSPDTAIYLNMLILLVIVAVLVIITDFITKKVVVRAFHVFAKRSKTHFDDMLIDHKTPNYIAHLVPLVLVLKAFPIVFLQVLKVSVTCLIRLTKSFHLGQKTLHCLD